MNSNKTDASSSELKQQEIDFLVQQNGKVYERMSLIEERLRAARAEHSQTIECMNGLTVKFEACTACRNSMQEEYNRQIGIRKSIEVCLPRI